MKKFLILLFIVFLTSELSYGQFALGLKIGYNANKLSTDLDSIKSQLRSGFHAGVFTRIGKRLYFAPELLYTLSGGVFTNEGVQNWKQQVTVGTMDVPLLLGLKIIHSKFITWRIELGPEGSFVVNKKITEKGSITGPITDADISTATWYILGGTGIDVLFLSLDVRYQYGLNDLIQDAQNYSFNTQNSMFLVSLGFKIFGKK